MDAAELSPGVNALSLSLSQIKWPDIDVNEWFTIIASISLTWCLNSLGMNGYECVDYCSDQSSSKRTK